MTRVVVPTCRPRVFGQVVVRVAQDFVRSAHRSWPLRVTGLKVDRASASDQTDGGAVTAENRSAGFPYRYSA